MSRSPQRVVVVQRRLTNYRVPLFERMRELLRADGLDLRVLHGDPTDEERSKRDSGTLPWAAHLETRYALGGRLCWQPFGRHIAPGDLVIVTQENRLLYNWWLLARARRPFRLAFWGHGRNFQSAAPAGWRERVKAWSTCRVDWWFAYTELSRAAVAAAGFPMERITVLNNAVDTRALEADAAGITPADTAQLRGRLGLEGAIVGVFLGSLTEEKRLDFLVSATESVHRRLPRFRLLVIGDGPRRSYVEAMAREHPWIIPTGALAGRDKALHLSLADVMLMPGMVGLVILDAFVLGLPLLTTDCGIHSPEIAYLEDGRNGSMTADAPEAYAVAVEALLSDSGRLAQMKAGARACAARYSLEGMAERFVAGIRAALDPAGGAQAVATRGVRP